MKNYNDLDGRGKFIRTVWFLAVTVMICIGLWYVLLTWFTMSRGFFVKLVVGIVLIAVVGTWQLVTTYRAWQSEKNDIY